MPGNSGRPVGDAMVVVVVLAVVLVVGTVVEVAIVAVGGAVGIVEGVVAAVPSLAVLDDEHPAAATSTTKTPARMRSTA
jgi:hypothetical protein